MMMIIKKANDKDGLKEVCEAGLKQLESGGKIK